MPETPADPPPVDRSPALTRAAYAPDVVAQSLEALFVYLAEDGAHVLRPIHVDALRLGWRPDMQPADVVIEAARRYGLDPVLVHSTSWRFVDGRVVLTYVAVVHPPAARDEYLADEPVVRAELARGDATGPPVSIDVAQVLEHAFRHLSWLVADDEVVRTTLPGWAALLATYEAEPFRAFGGPPAAQ